MTPLDEQCYLCGEDTEGPVEWCYGCKHFICDHHPNDVWGGHSPQDHDLPE